MKLKKILIISISAVAVVCLSLLAVKDYFVPLSKYNDALSLMESSMFEEAIEKFSLVEDFRDAREKIEECTEMMNSDVYAHAEMYAESKYWEKAFDAYKSLGGYLDSAEKAEKARVMLENELIVNCARKDTVSFGAYEQDGNEENGKEPIKWYVIAANDYRAQLLAVNALDSVCYHDEYKSVTWKDATVRKWLNEDFLQTAFTENEQKYVMKTYVKSEEKEDNATYVYDKVFLLSTTEVNNTVSQQFRQCVPTEYAKANGVYVEEEFGTCRWTLRTPGQYSFYAAYVYFDGTMNYRGNDVNYQNDGIRPTIWVNRWSIANDSKPAKPTPSPAPTPSPSPATETKTNGAQETLAPIEVIPQPTPNKFPERRDRNIIPAN